MHANKWFIKYVCKPVLRIGLKILVEKRVSLYLLLSCIFQIQYKYIFLLSKRRKFGALKWIAKPLQIAHPLRSVAINNIVRKLSFDELNVMGQRPERSLPAKDEWCPRVQNHSRICYLHPTYWKLISEFC